MKSGYVKIALVSLLLIWPLIMWFNQWNHDRKVWNQIRGHPHCLQMFTRLYAKTTLDFRIVFGYKDARPARFVGDRYERNALLEVLLAPCETEKMDCGFERSLQNSDLFEKSIRGFDGKFRKIQLMVVDSSVSPDDDENRNNPFQKWKSEKAKEIFFGGLRQADVVFYNGHSRDGGGPDFSPPLLTENKHVRYSAYKKKKTSYLAIQNLILQSKRPAQIIGLFSCNSKNLVPKIKPKKAIQWFTNDHLVYYAESLKSLREKLHSLLAFDCAISK